ncbi:hypothetical protein SD71_12800 [Cohnella kolymensis]|uniref:Uncharacterized protein n=1 Tax=Cohnella kolymensis TaxID=1590652 RepID=A0ABR5A3A3_9BACL|nr:hypothetical protein [Cohnella kolymensis]KIL35534.1 hypothetical protein SD71_12800 [Cohnella kolymensis]
MQLTYRFDQECVQIREAADGADIEFEIKILQNGILLKGIKEVQKKFEENSVYTDVLFYAYEDHKYKVIVRKDYYVEFILALMERQILRSVEWV